MNREELLKKIIIDDNGCWLWQGFVHVNGYGHGHHAQRKYRIHRLAYELFVGAIPEGMYVLHSCDVRRCCNPDHLRPGTQKDNMADMVSRGRNVNGERRIRSLTDNQVLEIKALIDAGERQVDIAAKYGVHKTMISHIKAGRYHAGVKKEG